VNAQSLRAKLDKLKDFCFDNSPTVLIASEARVKEEVLDVELKIDGYNIFRCNSHSTQTGGVVIYVKENIQVANVHVTKSVLTWIISLEIIGKKNLSIVGIYRSPNEKTEAFLSNLNEHFEKFLKLENEILCVGDININVVFKLPAAMKYLNLMNSLGLKQIIKEYTREDKKGAKTIIDHVLTNFDGVKYVINKKARISDHHLIEIYLNKRSMLRKVENKKFNCVAGFSREKFLNELEKFQLCDGDIDAFIEAVSLSIKKFIVVKEIKNNGRRWFSQELKELKKYKNSLYVKFCMSQEEEDYDAFQVACDKYKNELRKSESKFIQSEIEKNKHDPKKLWKILKSMYKEEQNCVERIENNGKIITDQEDIANNLNNFFVSSIKELVSEIQSPKNNNYLNNITTPVKKFSINEIDLKTLRETVKILKNKSYSDLISGKIYNEICQDEKYGRLMLECINKSLREGYFPNPIKKSTISPIPKVKNSTKLEDQRPVNNLPVLDKILETIVLNQLQTFIEEENILSDNQFGFRKKHDCETAVVTLIDKWYRKLFDDKVVLTVFLDFKRAFETIDRKMLIKKLEKLNFDRNAIRWFLSFLSDRTQKTKIGSCFSDEIDVEIGVPQGSKLSNLLFLLYINDIEKIDDLAEFVMYADDTSVTVCADDAEKAILDMNLVLAKIEDWLKFNKIAINVKKCKYMILDFNIKEKPINKIKMCNSELELVNEIKYLGVVLDSKIKFNAHADEVIKKLNKKLGFLRRNRYKLTPSAKMTFYKSLVLPHFDNCAAVLLLPNMGKIKEIENIQKRILRVVTNSQESFEKLLEDHKLVSARNRVRINVIKLISKINSCKKPAYLGTRFLKYSETAIRDLRNADNIKINEYKLIAKKSLFVLGVKDYNGFINYFKNIPDKKKYEKMSIINKIILYVKHVICI
jgi:exonuclease III